MKMHEDGTSKSSGYVEIPIQVLYKTEYIESVVQQRKKTKSLTNIMKKAKLRITNTFGKLKDRISSVLRGYYQEIVINNVDIKTRQNMMGYLKGMNLETKEFVDSDGTRVIIVDIGPIKKKPEMNDLLVYIENEKLKIARRTEAKFRGLNNKEHDDISNKWSVQNRGETSLGDTTTISEKMLQVHPCGGGDGIMRSSKGVNLDRNKTRTKHRSKKGVIGNNISTKKGVAVKKSDDNQKYIMSSLIQDSTKAKSNDFCLEDPLTKAERRVKLRMRSKSKATVKTNSTRYAKENRYSKRLSSCRSSSSGENKKDLSQLNDSTVESNSERMGWSINSFISPQMNGIGVFWNAQSVMYNDTKINLIERSRAIKEKEMSVNVIAQYYNREAKDKPVELKPDTFRTPLREEKATEIDNYICAPEIKAAGEVQLTTDKEIEMELTSQKSKLNKQVVDNEKPLSKFKGVECHKSSNLSYRLEPVLTQYRLDEKKSSKHEALELNNPLAVSTEKAEEPLKINKKKKRKVVKFFKKLFTNKNHPKKELNQLELKNGQNNTKSPEEVFVKYTTADKNKTKEGEKLPNINKDEKKIIQSVNKLNKQNNRTQGNCIASNSHAISRSAANNRSNDLHYATDSRRQWFDRGDNLKTSAASGINVSEFEIPPSPKNVSVHWKNNEIERIKEKQTKHRNVANKLYNKLKSFRSRREMSDSEMTSSTNTWNHAKKSKNSEKYCYDDFALSSLDSVRVSVDTVQSVTQTVIKRLAKSYPKEKRT